MSETWTPKSAAEAEMLPAYRNKTVRERMKLAIRWVDAGHGTQTEAAKRYGVTKSNLNRNIKKREAERNSAHAEKQEQDERVHAARQEIAEAAPVEPIKVIPVVHDPVLVEPAAGDMPPEQTDIQPWVFTERRVPPTLAQFNEYYFSGEICPDCGIHHDTPGYQQEIMSLLEDRGRRKKMINLAPYHAKSTICTLKSTLFELVRDPSSRTAVISAATPLARAFVRQIKAHLMDPHIYEGSQGNLIEDWGPFYDPQKWSEDEIYIAGRSGAQKDPSVMALGYGSQVYGRRFDRMIFDDIATLDNQTTPEAIEKMLRKIRQEYANRVGRTGQLIYVGTRVAPNDVYSVLDDDEEMNVLRYSCILDEEAQTTLWHDHFPFEAANSMRRSMPFEQWQLVYQNVETAGVGASFPQEVLDEARDGGRFLGDHAPGWKIVLGVDPAGANSQAGYTAMVVLGVDPATERRYLIDAVNRKQMKSPQVIEQILAFAEQYPLNEVRVEVNGLQAIPTDTPMLTRNGWSTMGGLSVGDEVATPAGGWTKVEECSPVRTRPTWDVSFSDGTQLAADEGHRWFVQPVSLGHRYLEPRFMTTGELMAAEDQFKYFRVAAPEPVEGDEQELPLDPYVFGAWLGDGTRGMAQFTQDDSGDDMDELRAAIELAGYETRPQSGRSRFGALGMLPALRATGAFHDKHVPDLYLRGSFKQRLALLQGLMDTDGTITGEWGHAVFYNTNPKLVEAVEFLLRSLGYRPSPARWHSHDRDVPIGAVKFYPNTDLPNPFRMSRKSERVQSRMHDRSRWLTIRSIAASATRDVRCIRVADPCHQFLAGRELIPTGNSQLFQYNDELRAGLTSRGVRLAPHITHGNRGYGGKWDPQFGVESMAPMFYNRMVSVPWADMNARGKFRELEQQLVQVPINLKSKSAASDLVMALWFAELGCREAAQRGRLPMFDPRKERHVPKRIRQKRRVVDFVEGRARVTEPADYGHEQQATQMMNVNPGVWLPGGASDDPVLQDA